MNISSAGSTATTGIPRLLEDLLAALEGERKPWSLLRPRQTLGLAEGDIDILVEPGHLGRLSEILASLNFVDMPMPGDDLHAAAYDVEAGRFLWIHAQGALEIAAR